MTFLITTERTQAAVMRLEPGEASAESLNTHRTSDQVLFVVEGTVDAEVGGEKAQLRRGDVLIVPAGTPHRFRGTGSKVTLAFNVYVPPAY